MATRNATHHVGSNWILDLEEFLGKALKTLSCKWFGCKRLSNMRSLKAKPRLTRNGTSIRFEFELSLEFRFRFGFGFVFRFSFGIPRIPQLLAPWSRLNLRLNDARLTMLAIDRFPRQTFHSLSLYLPTLVLLSVTRYLSLSPLLQNFLYSHWNWLARPTKQRSHRQNWAKLSRGGAK